MRARTVPVIAAAGLTSLAWPATADAHAIGTVTYQSPIPVWLDVLAGAAAVAASVPAAAFSDTRIGSHVGPNLYRPGSGRLVGVAQIVSAALLAEIVLAGLFGSEEFAANPATVLIWVDLSVGLGLVAALFGHVWDLVNPLRLIGDLVDRVNPQPPLAYPEALGQWPSVAALAAFGWMELAGPAGSHPFDLAVVIVLYVLVQVIGMALAGSAVWIERAELFTTFSRLSWPVSRPSSGTSSRSGRARPTCTTPARSPGAARAGGRRSRASAASAGAASRRARGATSRSCRAARR